MTTDQLLNLDCRDQENYEKLMKAIRKIKPFDNYSIDENIPISLYEKYIHKVFDKYKVKIGFAFYITNIPPYYYTVCLRETTGKASFSSIYGISIEETMAKLVIQLYDAIKTKQVRQK